MIGPARKTDPHIMVQKVMDTDGSWEWIFRLNNRSRPTFCSPSYYATPKAAIAAAEKARRFIKGDVQVVFQGDS